MTLVLLLAAAVAFCIWRIQRTTGRHPAPVPSTGRRACQVPYHCATFGHYYRKAFSDRWQCAECGHLTEAVASDAVLDAAAEDFRSELPQIEAFANGETL